MHLLWRIQEHLITNDNCFFIPHFLLYIRGTDSKICPCINIEMKKAPHQLVLQWSNGSNLNWMERTNNKLDWIEQVYFFVNEKEALLEQHCRCDCIVILVSIWFDVCKRTFHLIVTISNVLRDCDFVHVWCDAFLFFSHEILTWNVEVVSCYSKI